MDDKARSAGDASPAGSQAALLEDAGDATEPLTPADRVISITRPAETPSSLSDCPTPTPTQSQTPRCASPRSSSHAALLEDVALDDETPAADTADGGCCCCRNERCTNHAKVLTVALVLFLSITCAQFGLALLARSNTLLVDCASMLVDSATYAGNLWAVCRETNDPADAARGALVT